MEWKSYSISMIPKISLNQIVNKLHLEGLVKSMWEFRRDNSGGFLIPTSAKVSDTDYGKYRHLPINWSISPITKDDLPDEFSPQAVKTVDMFRRKTVDLPHECMIYFDYISGKLLLAVFRMKTLPMKSMGLFIPIF